MPEPGGSETDNREELPCISCVCVTRKKPALLQRAINCFAAQTYGHKELVIVFEDDDNLTAGFIEKNRLQWQKNIRVVCVKTTPKISLGRLRNLGIKAAEGQYICQWDDDDWYHKDRLLTQYNALVAANRDGAIMTRWLVFDTVTRKAYISNQRVWEGSILCEKNTLQSQSYADVAIGEDTPTIEWLVSKNCLRFIENTPGLYIYVYHGGNTWHYAHWQHIFECSTELSAHHSSIVAAILSGEYSVYSGSLLLETILQNDKLLRTESVG